MHTCHECDNSYPKTEETCPNCDTPQVKDVKASSNDMVAVHAVTVELEVDKAKRSVKANVGELWPLEGEDVSFQFIQQVELKFKRKNKFHGYYEKDSEVKVPKYLHKYLSSPASNGDFLALVTSLTNALKTSIFDTSAVSKASSSKIVFMHYKSTHNDDFGRVLAVMIDKKSGFDFTDVSMLPKSAEHLNLDALKQAVSIDVDLFDACYPDAPTSEAYLMFIRGSSSAEYFRQAFGCKEKSDNGKSLENLYKAIESFSTENKLGAKFSLDAEENLTQFLQNIRESDHSSFSLNQAAAVIENALPKEYKNLEGSFTAYVNQNELMINQYIEPTNKQISNQEWVDLSDQGNGLIAKLHTNHEIGHTGDGKDVEYNKDSKRLEIRIKSTKLRDKILRMIENSGE